jgi:hypothetical protein
MRAVCWGMFLFNAGRIGAYVLFQEHTREGFVYHLFVLALVAAWGWLLIRFSEPPGGSGRRQT